MRRKPFFIFPLILKDLADKVKKSLFMHFTLNIFSCKLHASHTSVIINTGQSLFLLSEMSCKVICGF